jgi:hypothetical protein
MWPFFWAHLSLSHPAPPFPLLVPDLWDWGFCLYISMPLSFLPSTCTPDSVTLQLRVPTTIPPTHFPPDTFGVLGLEILSDPGISMGLVELRC